MIEVTAGIGVILAILAISRKTGASAIGILIFSALIWPEYIRVPIGLLQLSVPRLVAMVLLIKYFFSGRTRDISFLAVDKLVIFGWVWTVFAALLSEAESSHVTQMIGRGLDTVLMYFVARIAFSSAADFRSMRFWLVLAALTMCVAGVYESITWSSPYHQFYSGGSRVDGYSEIRYGMLRAQASTQVSIYFGMAMSVVYGLLWALRGYGGSGFMRGWLPLAAATIATLSSLSSGPWIGFFVLVGLNLLYFRAQLIRPLVYSIFIVAVFLEVASNRHFYNLIDYLALDSATAWYRSRLIEIAVIQWHEYWIIGVGSNWPHHWAQLLDGRRHIDVVNNFIIIALYGGFPAMISYIAVQYIAIKDAVRAYRKHSDRKLIFGLAATVLALNIASFSVGLYGPVLLFSNLLLGMLISVSCKKEISPTNELALE